MSHAGTPHHHHHHHPPGSGVEESASAAGAADDAELTEAAAAAAAAVTFLGVADNDANNNNKWSKNGFGNPVSKQSGKFSKEESELVRKSVEEYCAAKQLSTAKLCSECEHKTELKGAWMEIARSLPHRSVQSVYRHGIRILHPFKRGAWSEDECLHLENLVRTMGKKWSAIQAKLNRSADSCRDKYREMSEDYVKGRWKEGETEQLKRLIRETVHVSPDCNMKELGEMVEQKGIEIPWTAISKKMGKRSRLSCFKKWQKMTGTLGTSSDDYKRKNNEAAVAATAAAAANPVASTTPATTEPDVMTGSAPGEENPYKRPKVEAASMASAPEGHVPAAGSGEHQLPIAGYPVAPTADAACGPAANDFDESAKIAAETVEAIDLPDKDTLVTSIVKEDIL